MCNGNHPSSWTGWYETQEALQVPIYHHFANHAHTDDTEKTRIKKDGRTKKKTKKTRAFLLGKVPPWSLPIRAIMCTKDKMANDKG